MNRRLHDQWPRLPSGFFVTIARDQGVCQSGADDHEGRWDMHSTKQKEQFSLAYVHAIAAHAGLNPSVPVVDDDSIDVMLKGKGYTGKVRDPAIQLQLKCTASPTIVGEVLKFDLPIKNYNDLRGTNVLSPRYLVVLTVPKELPDWIEHDPEHMVLHNRCFWVSLRHHPDIANDETVRVDIPMSQRLTTESVLKLVTLASNGNSA
ncbi:MULTISPECIES: DUF4365 domain-containing protein [Paraburkholderia]|uniref:DUF4365 domain-containing protein n=1 Tax=Paraburkholderia TaxID=1822464 RepID=UPI001EF8FAB5|nr:MULTISPECIES: DUF4365 domain-containing protein [Paraburkholderia]MDH6152621.1 hypothetical protein [Paraburkholderia sp. WSM4179]